MRIFPSSLLILVHVLRSLSLPITGATLDSGSTDPDIWVNYGVAEGYGNTIKEGSWSTFPSPSDIMSAAAHFKSTKFTNVISAMNNIVSDTATFRDSIKGALDAHHITPDMLTEEFQAIFIDIVNDLQKIPPPDKVPSHAERAKMVDKVLDHTTLALTNLASRYGIEEEIVTTYLSALKPHVHALTIAAGYVNEKHPQLLPTLAFRVAGGFIPEQWMLTPFLNLFGFGPAGPVKDSAVTWSQSDPSGAKVEAGSAAGMGVVPEWVGPVAEAVLLVGAILAMLLRYFKRG